MHIVSRLLVYQTEFTIMHTVFKVANCTQTHTKHLQRRKKRHHHSTTFKMHWIPRNTKWVGRKSGRKCWKVNQSYCLNLYFINWKDCGYSITPYRMNKNCKFQPIPVIVDACNQNSIDVNCSRFYIWMQWHLIFRKLRNVKVSMRINISGYSTSPPAQFYSIITFTVL